MTKNPEPLISVVLPVYNGEKYIKQTLESVLGQSYENIELIVIDDGSEDQSATIVKSITDARINYQFQENQGQSAAINFGVSTAKGAILCFIDADDLWAENKLSRQIAILKKNPDDLVFTYMQQFLSPEIERSEKVVPEAPQPGFSRGTMMLSAATWQKVGDFSTELKLGEFIDWFSRAREKGLTHQMIPEVLAFRRIHEHNISTLQADRRSDFVKIMKQRIDQKRKSSASN